jgi:hypothetical protein
MENVENKEMTREEILESSVKAREHEIMLYQLNIDNYTLALAHMSEMTLAEQSELSDFAEQLRNLLTSEKLEQKKSKIMLEVLKKQM